MTSALNAKREKSIMMESVTNVPREKLKSERNAARENSLTTTMTSAENVLKTRNTSMTTSAMFVPRDTN